MYDLIHALNALRKERGLELTDRIVVTLPRDADLLAEYGERIKAETLAVELGGRARARSRAVRRRSADRFAGSEP